VPGVYASLVATAVVMHAGYTIMPAIMSDRYVQLNRV
jgi:hypothetical protein